MVRITANKAKGMSWKAMIALVLMFTLVFSAFMHQGLLKPGQAEAAISRVQFTTGTANGATSITMTPLSRAPLNGNTLVAVISTRNTAANTVTSITQTGAAWTRVTQATNTTGTTTEIWYAPNVSGAGTAITITLTAATRHAAIVAEYSDLLIPTSTDQIANTFGASTAASTGATAATTQADELWFGGVGLVSSTYTLTGLTNSFTSFADVASANATATNNARVYALERIVAATGTASSGGTVSTSSAWSGAIATFKMATSIITSCSRCHGYGATFTDGTARNNPAGTFVGDHNPHVVKIGAPCSVCHVTPATETNADFKHRTGNIQMKAGASAISNGYYDKNNNALYNAGVDDTWAQTNTVTTSVCRNISCHGGNNPTPQWGFGTVPSCINCHSAIVPAANASIASGGTVTQRAAVTTEFGLAWGHKKTGRGAVTNADCIVCHLEGNYTSQITSAYHADGYIDLRDPDVAGETRITDISGTSFRFVQFSTSYAAGARTSTGHTSNNVDNVLTQKFCLACHDSNGATNTTARTSGGTAAMPWGGVALGANYTAANGAIGTQGLINAAAQFATANSSAHPVLGPRNKDFPTTARLNDPYKPAGTRGTSGTLSQGVVINCFDCHNEATKLTSRTVAAHGNAVTIPGVLTITGNAPAAGTNQVTFCQVCHIGYTESTNTHHNPGSALSGATNNGMLNYLRYACNVCHSSGYNTAVVRPVRAMDVHGSNVLPAGGLTKVLRWAGDSTGSPAQVNARPYGFIRNTEILTTHNPLKIGGSTYSPGCTMGNSTPNCSRAFQAYTVGGTY